MTLQRDFLLIAAVVLCLLAIGLLIGALRHHRLVHSALHESVLPPGFYRGGLRRIVLRALALIVWGFALLGPSFGTKPGIEKQVYQDVMLAVDFSQSMLAQDLPPNRLERVREVIRDTMRTFPQYRYGLILFAGEAYYRIPYTYDRGFILQTLDETRPADVQPQGTDLRKPIELLMEYKRKQQNSGPQTLILITDGEHLGNDPVEDLIPALREQQVRVMTVAVGSTEGAPVPLPNGKFVIDDQGQQVLSKPDRKFLNRIAEQTGGFSLQADNLQIDALANAFRAIERREADEQSVSNVIDRSIWFIAAGWLLLLLSWLPLSLLGRPLEYFRE